MSSEVGRPTNADAVPAMANWKITLEYDGTDFSGWQIQPNARTVQEELERGLAQITGGSVRVAGAGRTDSGVHAAGQVASVALEKEFRPEALQRSLNGVLPHDVVVLGTEVVPQEFHARFSAHARHYQYTILQRPTALERRFVWNCPYRLNDDLLERCAARIRLRWSSRTRSWNFLPERLSRTRCRKAAAVTVSRRTSSPASLGR